MLISHAQFQDVEPHIHVVSILKDIYVDISKKTRINDIGLDAGKGLRDNMTVNDINNCIVISDLLSVRGVGNSLRGWMR